MRKIYLERPGGERVATFVYTNAEFSDQFNFMVNLLNTKNSVKKYFESKKSEEGLQPDVPRESIAGSLFVFTGKKWYYVDSNNRSVALYACRSRRSAYRNINKNGFEYPMSESKTPCGICARRYGVIAKCFQKNKENLCMMKYRGGIYDNDCQKCWAMPVDSSLYANVKFCGIDAENIFETS